MTARRKAPHPFVRGAGSEARALTPSASASRLPSVAAILSALAIVTSAADAHAIVRTTDAGDTGPEDAIVDDADPDADPDAAPDATYCNPRGDVPLAGVQMPTRVHGTGCGCGSSGDDDSTAALLGTAAIGIALTRRRRS